jgi:glutamate-1-semialdehyde aminotransferase
VGAPCFTGVGSGWIISWRPTPPVTFNEAADADFDLGERFRRAMLDAGILLPPHVITDCRLNLAFTDDDVDETRRGCGPLARCGRMRR